MGRCCLQDKIRKNIFQVYVGDYIYINNNNDNNNTTNNDTNTVDSTQVAPV